MLFAGMPISRQSPSFASQDLFRNLQNESKRAPYGFPHDGNLSNAFRDAPRTCGSCREERNVTCDETMFPSVILYHKSLAGEEMDGLILVVMPFERSRRAIPNYDSGIPVSTGH